MSATPKLFSRVILACGSGWLVWVAVFGEGGGAEMRALCALAVEAVQTRVSGTRNANRKIEKSAFLLRLEFGDVPDFM